MIHPGWPGLSPESISRTSTATQGKLLWPRAVEAQFQIKRNTMKTANQQPQENNPIMFRKVKVKSLSPTLCDPVDCSPPGSSIHGILQARILEWVAISFSRDLPDPGIEPRSPTLQADALASEPPGRPMSRKARFK